MTGKLELAEQAQKTGTPIISSMGAGNKMDAAAFEVTDIYKTSVCPLARVMRRELKKRGVRTLKVVYSKEAPMTPLDDMSISCRTHCICPPGTARKCTQRRQVPGSNAFVPSVVGLILAGEVVKDLIRADEPAGSGDFRPQPLSTGVPDFPLHGGKSLRKTPNFLDLPKSRLTRPALWSMIQPTNEICYWKGAAGMFYYDSRMFTCTMDMAMPMSTFSCAHLLPFRNIRGRMCIC